MKQTKSILFALWVLMCLAGCSSNTYSDLRKKEDKLIANYIHYRVSGYDDLYFHLVYRGDSLRADSTKIDPVQSGDKVYIRYKKFALTEDPDTLSNWTTVDSPSAIEVLYPSGYSSTCVGWIAAIQLMQYSDSECLIICPSKQGFSDDNSSVTPYIYRMRMRIKP